MTEQITTKPFVSRRQQRMAFARKLPFAKRWAKQTDFAAIPEHKDAGVIAGAPLSGPGGLLSTPGLGTTRRKRKGKRWGMKLKAVCTCGVVTKASTGTPGDSLGPGITRIRGNLCNVHGRYGPCDASAAAPKPKGRAKRGRKGAAAKKPKVIHLTPEQKRAARDTEHAQNQSKVLSGLGIDTAGQAALEALRGGQQPDPKAIERGGFEKAGLVERASDGSYRMTASGRAAISAAQSGDAGRAGDIISSARDRTATRQGKRAAAAQRQQAVATRRAQVQARRDALAAKRAGKVAQQARHKALIVYKDHTGHDRWIARTTTAYKDRDGEIISEAALDSDSQRMTATKSFGPLRWWHVGDPDPLAVADPWGPGLDIGDCDFSVVIGRTRVESGTFRDPGIARKVAAASDGLEMSPGFFHPLDQPDSAGVFNSIRTFERSTVPVTYGRAANLFTGFTVKEFRMDIAEMEKRFKAMYTELGLTPEQGAALGDQLVATEKAATAQGIAYKDGAQPYTGDVRSAMGESQPVYVAADGTQGMIVNGMFSALTLKAFPPKAAAAPAAGGMMDAEDDPAQGGDSGVDEAAEGEPPIDGQDTGDFIGDMSVDDFKALLSELLAPVLKMQDMVKSIGDAHAELKGMYGGVATKDDARNQELIALKAQYAELATKIATIEGDQPAMILPDEVAEALKSAGPSAAATPESAAKQAALDDPARPFAWLGMATFPELYQNGENG
jgi:hypothetical protein